MRLFRRVSALVVVVLALAACGEGDDPRSATDDPTDDPTANETGAGDDGGD